MRIITIILSLFIFAFILSAHGRSSEFTVTPDNQNDLKYSFLVSTNSTQDGTAFQVIITDRVDDISSNCTVRLEFVTQTKGSEDSKLSSKPRVTPAIRIALKKDKRVWKADFVIRREYLTTPNLYFVFTEFDSAGEPSADFYEIKLGDFIK